MVLHDISTLKRAFEQPLPGTEAQLKMASSLRFDPETIEQLKPKARLGSVMVLLYPNEHSLCTVLTQRTSYKGVHSGQISFPGGKKDETDTDILQTALRETWEEIGLADYDIEIIGKLTELYIPASNFMVQPFVGYCEEAPDFLANPREVEQILRVPIEVLLDDAYRKRKDIVIHPELTVNAPYFAVDHHVVWGATAMMLSELAEILRPVYRT